MKCRLLHCRKRHFFYDLLSDNMRGNIFLLCRYRRNRVVLLMFCANVSVRIFRLISRILIFRTVAYHVGKL